MTMTYLSIAIFLFIIGKGLAQPQVLPQVVIEGSSEACPAVSEISHARNTSKAAIQAILRDTVVPELNRRDFNLPQCACGGPGDWTRMAYVNMTDPTQQCPSNWRLISSPVRSCGRGTTARGACDSATFPSGGRSYSRVCGRVIAYQKGTFDGFRPSVTGGRGKLTIHTLMEFLLHMEMLVHGSTSGHSWELSLNAPQVSHIQSVLVLLQATAGLTKSLLSLEIITSVTLGFTVLYGMMQLSMPIILCGMERGVVLLLPAVNLTPLHGSAQLCHKPLQMT